MARQFLDLGMERKGKETNGMAWNGMERKGIALSDKISQGREMQCKA
jgi:hypothetical protein